MRHNKRFTNICYACGYAWSPRGHDVSRSCPSCKSGRVGAPGRTATIGCGLAIVGFIALAIVVSALTSVLEGPNAGLFIGVVIGTVVLVVGFLVAKKVILGREATRDRERDAEYEREMREREAAQQRESREREVLRARNEAETKALERATRDASLLAKFGPDVAAKIRDRKPWVGATVEMLVETLGHPVDMSESVAGSKVKQVYKYERLGPTQFALQVNVDDGVVVGWERG